MDRILKLAVLCILTAVGGHFLMTKLVHQQAHTQSFAHQDDQAEPSFEGRASSSTENRARTSSRSVIIKAGRNGHFNLDARVNNRAPIPFVVDTGASFVALSYEAAQKAGIRLPKSKFVHNVSTANGLVKVASVTLRSVRYKSLDIKNVKAVVLPKGALAGRSLLGNSFLAKLREYKVKNGKLVMQP